MAARLPATVGLLVLEIPAGRLLRPTAMSSSRLMDPAVEDNHYARVIKTIILMTGAAN